MYLTTAIIRAFAEHNILMYLHNIIQDHRHNSTRFAKLAAAVFLRQNIRVYLFEGLVCTPMVPFSVGRVGAAAGIMITASHNPAKDNGCRFC
jgi:phosphomannomutase